VTAAFLDRLRIEQVDWRNGRPVWKTLAPLRYQSPRLGATVVIPAEFVTDLASVPRLPLTWFVAGGRAPRASVLHDYPYQARHWLLEGGGIVEVDRETADGVFWEAMLADPIGGTGPVIARLMWAAVRVGAGVRWDDSTRVAALNPIWTAQGWPEAP
jgi:hypothetical protein